MSSENLKFFHLIPDGTHIDFIAKFKLFVIISVVTCGAVFFGLFTKGLNFGIDFTGGSVVQVRFNQPKTPEEVRKLVAEIGEEGASVVEVGEGHMEYMITSRTAKDVASKASLQKKLVDKLGNQIQIQSVDVVGPKVGEELKWSAIQALVYSVLLIMVYIWLRFDFRFAPGATIAMIHDIIIATGVYVFTGMEFTITAVAALLTIAGYSVNDTIVIYDRVRELLKTGGDAQPLPTVINRGINLTLSRTLLTNFLTFLSVIPIAIATDGEIQNFAYAMLVGLFVGTYSTIYVAAPFTIYVDRYMAKKATNQRASAVSARA